MHPLHPIALLATWFGSGLLPKAPGTWGSLAALPFAYGIYLWTGTFGLVVATVLVFVIGVWASGRYANAKENSDPGEVVIDEVAGQWLALIPAIGILWYYPVAFVAFRIFDILKPWPVGWLDRHLKGGLGIMADDIAAGIYAALVCWAVQWIVVGINVL